MGRGCLAGPVVAGAAILPQSWLSAPPLWLRSINDSKKITPRVRERLASQLKSAGCIFGIGLATPAEIDSLNIHYATHLAMSRSLGALPVVPGHVLIDGSFVLSNLPLPMTAIVQGDTRSLSIAAASILAKVWRDQLLQNLGNLHYPAYGFDQHKGYPTAQHVHAICRLGLTPIHRRQFCRTYGTPRVGPATPPNVLLAVNQKWPRGNNPQSD